MSSVPSDQNRLDNLRVLHEKVTSGVAVEYTEAGERIRLPTLDKIEANIERLERKIARASSGSVFLVQPNSRL